MEEAATPFPREDTTPPVTKIYLGFILAGGIPGTAGMRRAEPPWEWQYEILWTELFRVSNAVFVVRKRVHLSAGDARYPANNCATFCPARGSNPGKTGVHPWHKRFEELASFAQSF